MGCKKDKPNNKERKAGMYECKKCGAISKKKEKV